MLKTVKTIFGLWLFVVVASCTKNETTTIVPIGTEYYIDSIFSVVPRTDTLFDTLFWKAFEAYPEGPIPPKIEGSYVVSPVQRVASNMPANDWPLQVVEPNAYLRFSDQHNGIVTMELNETSDHVTDTVFVMGHDLNFTVYIIEDKVIDDFFYQNVSYRLKIRRGVVMKGVVDTVRMEGKVKNAGLADFRMALVTLGMSSEPDGAPLQDVGSYFIYKDGDEYAEQFDW